jgi:hypothetical protein
MIQQKSATIWTTHVLFYPTTTSTDNDTIYLLFLLLLRSSNSIHRRFGHAFDVGCMASKHPRSGSSDSLCSWRQVIVLLLPSLRSNWQMGMWHFRHQKLVCHVTLMPFFLYRLQTKQVRTHGDPIVFPILASPAVSGRYWLPSLSRILCNGFSCCMSPRGTCRRCSL